MYETVLNSIKTIKNHVKLLQMCFLIKKFFDDDKKFLSIG